MGKPKYLLDPNGIFISRWGLLLFFATLVTATITPFEVAFLPQAANQQQVGFKVLNYVLNVIFWFDILLNFNTWVEYYHPKNGKLVRLTKKSHIAWYYMQRWFILDFLSVFPFDEVFQALDMRTSGIGTGMRMIRCLRMIKLLRFMQACHNDLVHVPHHCMHVWPRVAIESRGRDRLVAKATIAGEQARLQV